MMMNTQTTLIEDCDCDDDDYDDDENDPESNP